MKQADVPSIREGRVSDEDDAEVELDDFMSVLVESWLRCGTLLSDNTTTEDALLMASREAIRRRFRRVPPT